MNLYDVTSLAQIDGYEVRSRVKIVVWLRLNGIR
jgi:hypothetical protein